MPPTAEQTLVREIMQEKLVTIGASDRLSTVEDIMALGRVRHIPVVHGGRLVGVVSERDLLRASLSTLAHRSDERRAFLDAIDIAAVMSAPPIVVAPGDTAEVAALVMADEKIGCLPVVDRGELVGLVTETDLLRYLAGRIRERMPDPEA